MITRRKIRTKVMQAVYAWNLRGDEPEAVFEVMLQDFQDEIRQIEKEKGDKGDSKFLSNLFYKSIENKDEYDELIKRKADNWELNRIALVDRVLMQMGICEMLIFEEIPVKVSINEYLEIAKKYSTPKSSRFINGILDGLYSDLDGEGKIVKKGRGLIQESTRKKKDED